MPLPSSVNLSFQDLAIPGRSGIECDGHLDVDAVTGTGIWIIRFRGFKMRRFGPNIESEWSDWFVAGIEPIPLRWEDFVWPRGERSKR